LSDVDALIELCEKPGLTDFASDTYKNLTPEKARAFIEKEIRRFQSTRTGKFAVCSSGGALLGISGIFGAKVRRRSRTHLQASSIENK
jgi:peptide subunit release factor RF-3